MTFKKNHKPTHIIKPVIIQNNFYFKFYHRRFLPRMMYNIIVSTLVYFNKVIRDIIKSYQNNQNSSNKVYI